jgi:hypothetical protein
LTREKTRINLSLPNRFILSAQVNMSRPRSCNYCKNKIPPSVTVCPHCGRPSLFPNVEAAEADDERAALEVRYQSAQAEGAARGVDSILKDFESALANSSAVIARSVTETQRLATSDHELYATYYQLIGAGVKVPEGSKWDILRVAADAALFPNYKEQIRFAALSLDGAGLFNYGECLLVLKEEMIAHRASVFEENSVTFMGHKLKGFLELADLPRGYRATWAERGKLCVAKLHGSIDASTQPDKYSGMLLREGNNTEDDDFVEVHICGSMTARTLERVIVSPHLKRKQSATIIKALKEKLSKLGVGIG